MVGVGEALPPSPHPVLPVGLGVPGAPLAVMGEIDGEVLLLPLFPPPLGDGLPLGVFCPWDTLGPIVLDPLTVTPPGQLMVALTL